MRAARAAALLVAAAAALALGGCVPGRDSAPASDAGSAAPAEAPTDAQGVERCTPTADSVVEAISDPLVEGVSISNPWTVRSRQFDSVYFTSARVERGDEGGEETATWATLAPEGGQFLFAVTDLARDVGDFRIDTTFTGGDDGVRESQRCARVR